MSAAFSNKQCAGYGVMQRRIRSQELLPKEIRHASTPERVLSDTKRRERRNEAQAQRELAQSVAEAW